jgi:ABC-type molybdate transport system substrate-binding protein
LLTAEGVYDSVAANLQVDSATGDFLVNQIRAGSLDAVIVYRSNAKSNPANLEKFLDIVEIGSEGAKAEQPFAIARDTKYKYLLQRLFDRVLNAQSKANFESYGFVWRAKPE